MQLGALGLGTVLFQFAVGFFLPLIIATTPRVAAAHAADNGQVGVGCPWLGTVPQSAHAPMHACCPLA